MSSFKLSSAFLLLLVVASCGPPSQLNIVIVTLDTTRADRLGTYGYTRNTSPNFDALANDSIVFERAYSQSATTSPSHLSMMTGLRPQSHGVFNNGQRIRTEIPTLAERLSARGYRTAAFVSAAVLSERLSDVSRGFETFDANFPALRRGADSTTRAALAWLENLEPGSPHFLFVHYYDAHGPFRATEERIAEFRRNTQPIPVEVPPYQRRKAGEGLFHDDIEYYSDVYDAAIQQQDESVARLLGSIDKNRSIIIVLADHGESLGERIEKLDHGHYVYEEATRIPLLFHAPGLTPRRVTSPVETSDLVPTLLDWLGIPADDELDGVSLVKTLKTGAPSPRANALSFALVDPAALTDREYDLERGFPIASLVTSAHKRWKLIRYPGAQGPIDELFDLENDPLEKTDVAESHADVRDEIAAQLDLELIDFELYEHPPLSEELTSQLEALGYAE
ncbi:MAG: sulfatase [Myxococcota bacterium]|nr:sulfatase [Myxococcota bacterium]